MNELIWHETPFPYLELYVEEDFVYCLFFLPRSSWFVSGRVVGDRVIEAVKDELMPGFTLENFQREEVEERFLDAVRQIECTPEISRTHCDSITDGVLKVLAALHFGLIAPFLRWENQPVH